MMMQSKILNIVNLERIINQELNVESFKDYAPNGIQIEGKQNISKIVTGVTASQALIDEAIKRNADAIIVHHGYFWKGENPILRGMKHKRIKSLLMHDISLLAYHLPLDAHPTLGNNAQLAKLFDIETKGFISDLVPFGEFKRDLTWQELSEQLESVLQRKPLHSGSTTPRSIKTVAWCTGGGQGFIEQAAEFGVDAFISGEVSEQTVHIAREMGLHYFAAGHHATERYGVKALGEWLAKNYHLDVEFVDIDNPA